LIICYSALPLSNEASGACLKPQQCARLQELYKFPTLETQGEAIILGNVQVVEITTTKINEIPRTAFLYCFYFKQLQPTATIHQGPDFK